VLLYIWFATGRPDAQAHRREVERFANAVTGGAVTSRAVTYQAVFAQLTKTTIPIEGWHEYVATRYFRAGPESMSQAVGR
jgi:hypothetical protein